MNKANERSAIHVGPPKGKFAYLPIRTPGSDGFIMPAEWEPHEKCWMAWPRMVSLWGEGMDEARETYAAVARAISRFEPVTMLAHPEDMEQAAGMCGPDIEVLAQQVEDSWTRDSGPTFVQNQAGEVAGVDWVFNGWGHFYSPVTNDESMALDMLRLENMRRYASPFILEGGSIHVDGKGTLVTTEQCLLDPRRNIGLTKQDFEDVFAAYLGIRKVIWLGEGLEGDDTNGHVDIVACFARPGTVLLHSCDDPDDPNHDIFMDNLHRLELSCDADGNPLEVVLLPQPARQEYQGKRLDLSYVNFYLANGGVVMSSFDDPRDDEAYHILKAVFPDRTVVRKNSLRLFKGGGGIHCITQQQPRGAVAVPF